LEEKQEIMEKEVINWLLEGEPWVRYRTMVDLLGKSEEDKKVLALKKPIAGHKLVKDIFSEQSDAGWWTDQKNMYRYAGSRTLWQIQVLADFGFRATNPGIARGCEFIAGFQFPFGGFKCHAEEKKHPMDCATGLALETLMKVGFPRREVLERGYDWLISRQRLDGGWIHSIRAQVGKSHEKDFSCPWASLCMTCALAEHPDLQKNEVSRRAVEFLLGCWERKGRTKGFGIGTEWRKLRYPFTGYRLFKFADCLSRFEFALKDQRIGEICDLLISKQDENGRFRADSVHKAWADFDFGQKESPSRWITFLVLRIKRRLGRL
jgi:hypothetical protein